MSKLELQVRYQETDAQGRVYHSNYFVWYDMARTEYLREKGISYRDLEKEGVFFVVASAKNDYLKGLEFDDVVLIETSVAKFGAASVEFTYDVYNKETKQKVSVGWTKLAVVDRFGKITKVPNKIVEKLN